MCDKTTHEVLEILNFKLQKDIESLEAGASLELGTIHV